MDKIPSKSEVIVTGMSKPNDHAGWQSNTIFSL